MELNRTFAFKDILARVFSESRCSEVGSGGWQVFCGLTPNKVCVIRISWRLKVKKGQALREA